MLWYITCASIMDVQDNRVTDISKKHGAKCTNCCTIETEITCA